MSVGSPARESSAAVPAPIVPESAHERAVTPSGGCGCASCQAKEGEKEGAGKVPADAPPWAFALGQIGYDLISEARRDSIREAMGGEDHDPEDPAQWLDYLKSHPWDAASVHWTLKHDRTPIYTILPAGPYARETYDFLIASLRRQLTGKPDARNDQVAIPGRIAGQAKLLDGTLVPVIFPERRGMQPWNIPELLDRIAGQDPAKRRAVGTFLDRVVHELRGRGTTPAERAINYSTTGAATIGGVFDEVLKSPEPMELDSIGAEPGPPCRVGSDCHDVKLFFFYPGARSRPPAWSTASRWTSATSSPSWSGRCGRGP